ncbi:hypothetical protein RUND412_010476 [Rhizina undulata]
MPCWTNLSSDGFSHKPVARHGGALTRHFAMYISARNNTDPNINPKASDEENHSPTSTIPKTAVQTFKSDSSIATEVKQEQHDGPSSISFTSSCTPADRARESPYIPTPSPTNFMAVRRSDPLPPNVLARSRPEVMSAIAENRLSLQLLSHTTASKESEERNTRLKRVASPLETHRVFKKPALTSNEGNRPQSHAQTQTEAPHYYPLQHKPRKFVESVPVTNPKSSTQPPPRLCSSTSSGPETPPVTAKANYKSKSLSFQEDEWLFFHITGNFPEGKPKDWTGIAENFNSRFGKLKRLSKFFLSEKYSDLIARGVTAAHFQLDPALGTYNIYPLYDYTLAEDHWIRSWAKINSRFGKNRDWQLCAEDHGMKFPMHPRTPGALMARFYALLRALRISPEPGPSKPKASTTAATAYKIKAEKKNKVT